MEPLRNGNDGKLQADQYVGSSVSATKFRCQQIMSDFGQCSTAAGNGSLSDILLRPEKYEESLLDDLLLGLDDQPLILQSKPYHSQHNYVKSSPSICINGTGTVCTNEINRDSLIINPHHKLAAPSVVNFNLNRQDVPMNQLVLPPPLPAPAAAPPPPQPGFPLSVHTRRPPMRKGTPSYRNNHIHTERQRRQDMTFLFNKLRSLLPNMQQDDLKVDRCTTVAHVIDYVQELDRKVQALGKVKAELSGQSALQLMQGPMGAALLQPDISPAAAPSSTPAPRLSVSVRFCGPMDIFITLNCPKQRGLWPDLLALLQETLHLHIHNVAVSSTSLFCVHSIYAKVMDNDSEDVCCDKLQRILSNFVASHAKNSIMF